MKKKNIVVVLLTPSPPGPVAHGAILSGLRQEFSDYDLELIYVVDLMKRQPFRMAMAAIVAVLTYFPQLITRRKVLKYAFFRTPFVFRWIKEIAAREIDPNRFAFCIQLQSLFDASVPGLPNFVYTDHVHLENLNFDGFRPNDLYSRGWRKCEAEIYRSASLVFVWSSNVVRCLVKEYGIDPERVECIYAGSNSPIPERQPVEPGRYARKEILFVGVDWIRKGGPVLVKAFRALKKRHPDASLKVIGRVPKTEDINGVNYLGIVPLDELPYHYRNASVFCMPTRLEPFGNVFLEAMWQQLPVVATRVGALPDIVEDGVNGYLVSPDDWQTLSDRLSILLDDADRCASMGIASREKAESLYSWPQVMQRLRRSIDTHLLKMSTHTTR